MDDERKCFTFIWEIKNFSFSFNYLQFFRSPVFYVHEISRSKWNVVLFPKPSDFEDCVVCSLWRTSGPSELELDYEFSFITSDGSVMHSEIFRNKTHKKVERASTSAFSEKRELYIVNKKHMFIPDDTLTIRCRLWKSHGSFSESERCSVESQIEIECLSFVGTIEKFSSLKISSENMVCIKSSEKKFLLSPMKFSINDKGKLYIIINSAIYETSAMYQVKTFIIDAHGNKVKSCQGKIFYNLPFRIPLTFSMKRLIENKERYLPDDELTLLCKVSFGKGNILDGLVYDYDSDDAQATISKATNTTSSFEEHPAKISILTDDLISFFNEGILYDTKLKTATETFPAHTVVLSARSPVFKSMFTIDMREKANKCVNIEDLDADTVRKMLLFMYKDKLDNLDYKSAKSLYFAADKYNIDSLRHKCSNFLKQNILHSNCCDILLFADKHHDTDLKKCVQNCIAENDAAVFSSDEWKNLEENHPRLTIEILRTLYMKNKKT